MISSEVIKALRNGTVPLEGTELIAVGIDKELNEIENQLDKVKSGSSDFKFIIGDYGSGKTFFASSVRKLAFDKNFVVSSVVISSETPLNRFEDVYKKIVENMRTPENKKVPALSIILEEWLLKMEEIICDVNDIDPIDDEEIFLSEMEKRIEMELTDLGKVSSNFANAIRTYYKAKTMGDSVSSQAVLAWLKGEKISLSLKKTMNVAVNLERSNAILFVKAINMLLKSAGYAGLVIILDEIETVRNYVKKSSRDEAYENLRYFVDGVDGNGFENCFFLYSGTTELMETERGFKSLEPLYQRIKVEKEEKFRNLRQPVIYLKEFNNSKLFEVSEKVRELHGKAHGWNPLNKVTNDFINKFITDKTVAFNKEIEISPRGYLRVFVDILDKAETYEEYWPEKEFKFDEKIKKELQDTEKEEAHILNF
ncbi:MAG: DUF2791 family P-loop domain-containing protein [Fusobacteriaceae bacterium]|nr:DUF2791 family P-loop domain-containing protein [Fusobacteriaceae bacterium]